MLEASSPVTPNAPGQPPIEPTEDEKLKARREFLTRIMKKALRKSSNTSEDESHIGGDDGDETDTEQHEQLPHDRDTTIDKRNSSKRRKSIVQLVDDKKIEQASQSQAEPLKHHHHRHHHHRQQLPRKLSFMQLREIAETSHQKSDQISDEAKPIESVCAIVEAQAKEKCIPTEENAHNQDDEYNKMNVVSERRALRRQQNARESESSLSLQMSMPDATNYGIVNEKPKPIEKPPRNKSPLKGNSPDIFKFDANSTKNELDAHEHESKRENDESEAEQSGTLTSSIKGKSPTMDSAMDLQSSNPSPTASFQLHSPKEIELNVSSGASTPLKSSGSGKNVSQTPSPQQSPLPSPSPSEKVSKHGSGDDILNKPIRKLNSLFALVKDAVHSKKPDQPPQPPPLPPPPPQKESSIDASPPHDLVSRVKLFIDDSNSVSMSESIKTTTESVTSSKLTCYEASRQSLRRLRHAEQTKPKRQDSQASIWSENIPVITISKSESSECILERCDNDGVELSASKK